MAAAPPIVPARPAPPSRTAARLRTAARRPPLLLVLAAAAVLTRLPSLLRPLWNPDEGFLATEARMLAHGGVLYATVVDRKPPLLPWLYQGAFALFGDGSLLPLRLAAVAAQWAAAALLAATARRRAGPAVRERAAAAAGLGYLAAAVGLAPQDTQAAGFEVFMVPWTAAAFWWADRADRTDRTDRTDRADRSRRCPLARRWLPAGLAAAGAALTKQTGAAVLLPLAVLAWCEAPGSGAAAPRRRAAARLRAGLLLATGFAAPVAAVAAATGPARFLFWTVTGSRGYLSVGGDWVLAAERGLGNAAILLAGCAGLAIPAVMRAGRTGSVPLRAWLAASAPAVATGARFYGHYYLQLVPPLVLLGTAALESGTRRLRRAAAAWTALACCAFVAWGLAAPRTGLRRVEAVAAAVDARTAPGEAVLVWGMHPEEYWLARRPPAVRYLTAGFLTGFGGGRGAGRVGERYAVAGAWRYFRRQTASRPPVLVVDDSRGAPYRPERIAGLRRLLAGYRRAGTAGGAVLYIRRR